MHHVSLFIELLRSRPRQVFWFATLTQAVLWTLVPTFFYSAPPGDLATVLAIGREFTFGSDFGPPLSFWLAEIAYRQAGLFGVYALAQICVVIAYWAVFALGTDIAGERQAALAALLLVGVTALTVPTPDFGPAVLAMPLWALSLLYAWRAVGEKQRVYWYVLAVTLGLLLLTTNFGLVAVVLLILFLVMSERGRASLGSIDFFIAGIIVVLMIFPHLIWIDQASDNVISRIERLRDPKSVDANLFAWLRLFGYVALGHAGLATLVTLASNLGWTRQSEAVAIERPAIDPFARNFVYFFAIVPPLVVTMLTVVIGHNNPVYASPLLVLSGLAVVIAAGSRILIHHQSVVVMAWFVLLLLPPVTAALAMFVAPWTIAIDLKSAQPAADMGKFLSESFERRTGQPLAVVAGDQRLAELVAVYGGERRSRPHVYVDDEPDSPVTRKDIADKGAIVVWMAPDNSPTVPPEIKARFPDLVPEVPRAFERPVQGRLPLFRVGWGMIRPAAQSGVAPPSEPAPTAPVQ
jgi:hypothetical protein